VFLSKPGEILSLKGQLVISRDIFVTFRGGSASIWYVGVRVAAQHPLMPRTASHDKDSFDPK
jgi:hypothetical protein